MPELDAVAFSLRNRAVIDLNQGSFLGACPLCEYCVVLTGTPADAKPSSVICTLVFHIPFRLPHPPRLPSAQCNGQK